jgi:Tfp pilus assembly protein PilF
MLGNLLRRFVHQVRRDSSDAEYALNEVREALRVNNYALTKAAVERALRADPYEAKAYLFCAPLARRAEEFDAAESDYRRALVLRPESSGVRVEFASVLHRLDRVDEALAVIDEALAIEPASSLATVNRGLLLQALGRFDEAEHAFRAASALDPSNASTKSHLASIMADQGRTSRARELLLEILVGNEENLDVHWALAIVELALGMFASGFDHYAYRLKRHNFDVRPRDLPWWTPGPTKSGRLLVLAEQALGH